MELLKLSLLAFSLFTSNGSSLLYVASLEYLRATAL